MIINYFRGMGNTGNTGCSNGCLSLPDLLPRDHVQAQCWEFTRSDVPKNEFRITKSLMSKEKTPTGE